MFFHSVALIADRLTQSQRFEESMNWWHYIFNPIANDGDLKNVWQFLPFRETDAKNVLESIFNSLDPNTSEESIDAWRDNPFQPHLVARDRPVAYMYWVVMKYVDNLIAWGDYLFRQDTRETITQATQLYILANHILGPRPEAIPKRGKIQTRSYLDLLDQWDAFSNAMDEMELIFPFSQQISAPVQFNGKKHYGNIYGFATALYFCIPNNPKLLEKWDTVADRLYKIRHCLNIEGIFRSLALFDPPIDPALLVRAAAQGLSLSSVLNDLNTPMPNYRFTYLLQRAQELTSEVKSLGNALLSALEKKDNEAIGLLRAGHETNIQNLAMEIKKHQLEEAEKALAALYINRKSPEYRLQYYQRLTGNDVEVPGAGTDFKQLEDEMPGVVEESGLKLIPYEKEDMDKASDAQKYQPGITANEVLASILNMIPSFSADFKPMGVGGGISFGGSNIAAATQAIARGLQHRANELSYQSGKAGKKSGFLRQLQGNLHQANLVGFELMQIDRQITSQEIRVAMAQQEINNQQVQIDNAQEAEDFLRNKYSNEQLYQWMAGQLKTMYYQVYTLAYDLAKKAEKVYRFEKGLDSNFIQFGYFDSANNGLLAGERLYLALKQLETAYIENRGFDYEITKHISLLQLNPLALIQLKETGVCEFEVPEVLFDLDYAGHYKRRIKTVAITIPCIVGPYTSLNCTLRLLKHEYRNTAVSGSAYPKNLEESDERFVSNLVPINAIAVSQGQNDSGVFELSFSSERYLPFEGAGAVSTWRLELPTEYRQFDYDTISDAILHLRYTSSEGGVKLRQEALGALGKYVKDAEELSKTQGLFRMFSLKHEFPNEWYRFLQPDEGADQVLMLSKLWDRFPFFAKNKKIQLQQVMLFCKGTLTAAPNWVKGEELPTGPGATAGDPLSPGAATGQLKQYLIEGLNEKIVPDKSWALLFPGSAATRITGAELADAWVVLKYTIG